jgi:hypothetical protein
MWRSSPVYLVGHDRKEVEKRLALRREARDASRRSKVNRSFRGYLDPAFINPGFQASLSDAASPKLVTWPASPTEVWAVSVAYRRWEPGVGDSD